MTATAFNRSLNVLKKVKAGFYTFASDECADFLDKLNSPVIPGTSGFRGN